MHALGDRPEAARAVEHGVHRRDDGQQHLRRADVGRRLLAPDVLLARLKREAVGRIAPGIDRDADETPRQRPLVGFARCQICGVGPAEAHRDAVALHRADRDVGPHLARRLEQRQGQRVRRHDRDRAGLVQAAIGPVKSWQAPQTPGYWKIAPNTASGSRSDKRIADYDLPAERRGPGLQHRDRLGQAIPVDEEHLSFGARDAAGHAHRLGRGGRLVEQRGIGDVQAGQVAHERLEIQERLEAALADFRLIGRVGGVPGRVLEDVALDGRRHGGAVVALADERDEQPVLVGGGPHVLEDAALREGGPDVDRLRLAYIGRQGLVDQGFEAGGADHIEACRRSRPPSGRCAGGWRNRKGRSDRRSYQRTSDHRWGTRLGRTMIRRRRPRRPPRPSGCRWPTGRRPASCKASPRLAGRCRRAPGLRRPRRCVR